MERVLGSKISYQLYTVRTIFTTAVVNKDYVYRQSKMLTKIMHGSCKKKKLSFDHPPITLPNPTSLSKNIKGQGTSKRRKNVLNKLFMKYITDIMAMGSISTDIVGRGIEISRVNINSDYNKVNVYWLAKGTEKDFEIEKILLKSAAELRHELSQLRIMGQVPRIEFIKDKYYALVAEVDSCLNKADFGEDYVPTDSSHRLRSELSLNMSFTDQLQNKISQLDKLDEEEIPEDPLPIMSMNAFGLDIGKIVKKVQQAKQQSNLAWEKSKTNIAFTNDDMDQARENLSKRNFNIENIAYQERKGQFKEFLLKRQIEKNKASKKVKHRSQQDKEFILHELSGNLDEPYLQFINDDKDDDLEET